MSTMDTFTLPDGRIVQYTASGPVGGMPLVFHHASPGSALQLRVFQRIAHAHGLRLISYSRPGYGDSTRRPGRDVAAAVVESEALLDHLDAPRCLVAGWSGGGPHALAMAAGLPERVAAVATIAGRAPSTAEGRDFTAGMGEADTEEHALSIKGEDALRPWLERSAVALSGGVPAVIESMSTLLSAADLPVVNQEFGEDLAGTMAYALRTSVHGWLDDSLAAVRPWGFALEDLTVPCSIWHGSEDFMVPFAHGQWLAEHIHGATAHLRHGEGHFSICPGKFDSIVEELVSHIR